MRGDVALAAIAMLGFSGTGLSAQAVAPKAQPPAQVKVPTFTPVLPQPGPPRPAPPSSPQLAEPPTGPGRCGRLAEIIKSDAPTEGALSSLSHATEVLKATLDMIDFPCGAPYIVSTDKNAIAQERERVFQAWSVSRANCLKLLASESVGRQIVYCGLPD